MKKTLTLVATPLVMLAAAGTAATDMGLCLTPYVGVDAQYRHMPFEKKFGGNVLKRNYPQGNFFAGLKFNDCVGIEAGYEVAKKKSVTKVHRNSDVILGRSVTPSPFSLGITNITSHGTSKIHGWNLNLVGFLPICEDLQLIGSIGLAQLKFKSKNTLTISELLEELDFDFNPIPVLETVNVPSTYKKRKAVLRLAAGMQHMITDCIGIRGLISWENTSKFKAHAKRVDGRPTMREFSKAKNSFQYGLGLYTIF